MKQLELSTEDLETLEYIYTAWPSTEVPQVIDFVLPKEHRLALLSNQLVKGPFKDLIESWEHQDLQENSPFRALATPFNPDCAGVLCYPSRGSFALSARPPGEVTLESVRLAVTEIVVAGLIVFLADLVPKQSGSMEPADLYRALRDPEGLEEMSFAGKWLYACYREAIILPRFGSVEAFIQTIQRLRKKSRGYGLLLLDAGFGNETAKALLPKDDPGLTHLAEMLFLCDNDDNTCANFYYHHFMWEYSEYHHQSVWTAGDMRIARGLLEKFGVKEMIKMEQ